MGISSKGEVQIIIIAHFILELAWLKEKSQQVRNTVPWSQQRKLERISDRNLELMWGFQCFSLRFLRHYRNTVADAFSVITCCFHCCICAKRVWFSAAFGGFFGGWNTASNWLYCSHFNKYFLFLNWKKNKKSLLSRLSDALPEDSN